MSETWVVLMGDKDESFELLPGDALSLAGPFPDEYTANLFATSAAGAGWATDVAQVFSPSALDWENGPKP